jgi:ABC-type transport system involved in multi-copper enzyme maturation permease subunit
MLRGPRRDLDIMGIVWTLAMGTYGEALRRKILNIFLLVGLAMIVLFFAFSSFTPSQELVIMKSTGLGIIGLTGVFISVILGINLIPNEIDKRTIYTILSKPVHRAQFLLGKFLGGLLTVFVNIFLMGIVFLVAVMIKRHSVEEFSIMDGILMIFFQMMLINAVAMLLSVFVSPFVNFFLTFAIYIVGSMSSVTESLAEPDPHKSVFVEYFFKFVHFIIPNFGNFNIQNPIIHPDVEIIDMAKYMQTNMLYALLEVAIMLLIAVLIFDRREV